MNALVSHRRASRRKIRVGIAAIVVAAVAASLGIQNLSARAHADEVGFAEAGGLKIETIGADAGLVNEKINIDLPDLTLGLEIDFQHLTQDLGVDPSLLANNVSEPDGTKALNDAIAFVARSTGFQLDNADEVRKLSDELTAVHNAIDGYLASNPANVDPSTPAMKEILDTTLPLFDAAAACRGRCLQQGAIRLIAIGAILEIVKFAVNASDVDDKAKTGTEAAMLALQAIIPIGVIMVNRWRALPADQQGLYVRLGLFTGLNNLLSLLTQRAAVGVAAIGGDPAFAAATTAVAQAVVAANAAGSPPGGAVAIDIHDEL